MKKVSKLLLSIMMIVMIGVFFTGCKKPTGTFYLDNSTEYSMDVSWGKYDMSVGAYGHNGYTVEAGAATAEVWANGYGYWGSLYFEVPDGGSNTLYMYWSKKSTGEKSAERGLSTTKPKE